MALKQMLAAFAGSTREPYQAIAPGTQQRISFTGTASQSAAFGAAVTGIWIFSEQNCWVRFGTNPTAAVNDGASTYTPGGIRIFWVVRPGEKISVIRDTTSGYLHICEGRIV